MDFLVATGCQNSPTQLPNIVTPNVSPTQDSFDDGDALPTLNISPDNRDPSADELMADFLEYDVGELPDIRDEAGHSRAKKEKSALRHLNNFLTNHFQEFNRQTFQREFVPAEQLTFEKGRLKEVEWWDDMIGKFFNYLAEEAVDLTILKADNPKPASHISYSTAIIPYHRTIYFLLYKY